MSFLQRAAFRWYISGGFSGAWRRARLFLLGAQIGPGTSGPSGGVVNWPHQLRVGRNCILENDISFIYAAPWEPARAPIRIGDRVFVGRFCEFNICGSISVGDDALIASGCKFIDHDHSIEQGVPINQQPNRTAPIVIERDVWLGVNVVVLKGVTIGKGAIVGAGAVVTKSVPSGEIWGGIPARKIGQRPPPHSPTNPAPTV